MKRSAKSGIYSIRRVLRGIRPSLVLSSERAASREEIHRHVAVAGNVGGGGDNAAWKDAATVPLPPLSDAESECIDLYRSSARIPFFSKGYEIFKLRLALEVCASKKLRQAFMQSAPLPERYGSRLDERIVEYPWVFSRLLSAEGQNTGPILDAGSTLNKKMYLESPIMQRRQVIIYTFETDYIAYNPPVSYMFGDLRDLLLKDEVVDTIVCISTLEHVGFTYDYKTYSRHNPWPYAEPESYLDALREFRRVLRPGGRLLLTLPFGRFETHGWLQQFDKAMIERVKSAFGGTVLGEDYYRYKEAAWQIAKPEDCAELSYFNIHETGEFEEDGLAAARAICCLDMVKQEP